MAFEKHYPQRKDRRRQYPDAARAVDPACRSHGGCPHCEGNRQHAVRKADDKARAALRELLFGA